MLYRGILTLVAGNAETAINDFELALIGQTSEYAPDALNDNKFGMAYKFVFINWSLSLGNKYNLGFGESLGKIICDDDFRREVLSLVSRNGSTGNFSHPEISVFETARLNDVVELLLRKN